MGQDIMSRYKALKGFEKAGFSVASLKTLSKTPLIDVRLGSPSFFHIWRRELELKNPKEALRLVLNLARMPIELSGDLEQTQELLTHFHPDLAPDHPFWSEFSSLVDRAFPERTLGRPGQLERRLHQFRYVISSQQAQYIRHRFKTEQMTDAQALAQFLSPKKGPAFWRSKPDYSLMDSARLHNKLKIDKDSIVFPDHEISYNIKVLVDFHTEFILDSQGNFLNEVDGERVTEKGVVNGASFNFGTDGPRHWDLDVDPIRRHDPEFRRQLSKGYRSPSRVFKQWFRRHLTDYDLSYFNKKSPYARGNRSSFSLVKKEVKKFKKQIKACRQSSFWL
ncbi:DUF3114 domain-containing protein [Streptococcus ictaluri]|uniref:DUF3114 domain-containing protein n=1 Tax=Streptococcus ictaluri 707-05 TaxID=764299 RepID=G5K1Z1_9STRE|nr:DUF3114 domain-containing protein [Streptococcus ictaluri]EHI69998.1 hypothetical protein STRIC_2399 [Streptococcus ictaluri 707-05]